jgi:DNA-binding transcriptional regulator YiaG
MIVDIANLAKMLHNKGVGNLRTSKRRIYNRFIVSTEVLTEARKKKNLTLVEVAREMGVHKSTISRWENGKVTPTDIDITRLAELYGMWGFIHGNPKFGQNPEE